MKQTPAMIAWITGLLVLIIILVIGTMMYVKIAYDTLPEAATNTAVDDATSPSPSATGSPTVSQKLDTEFSTVDSELEGYTKNTAEVDAAINDEQEDLSE
jgi:Skp family chaperone for outer membrane proteins